MSASARTEGKTAAEMALLLALLGGRPNSVEIDELAGAVTDWTCFLALARRHRVVSLVAKRLPPTAPPEKILAEFCQNSRQLSKLGMLQLAEARRLTELLESEGIACLLLKGAGLAIQTYGHPLLRDGRDIDLLVAPRHLQKTEILLSRAGLHMEKPTAASPARKALYRRYSHEYQMLTPTGVIVELKSRLSPTPSLMSITADGMLDRRAHIAVAGVSLPVPGKEDLLLYLCGHGARHCWFRLKWLADIAALLADRNMETANRLLLDAERLGAEVPALEALQLAHDWLGSPLPAEILDRARSHPLVRRRIPLVEQAILTSTPPTEPHFERMLNRAEYLLRPDAFYRLAVLERHAMVQIKGWLYQREGSACIP